MLNKFSKGAQKRRFFHRGLFLFRPAYRVCVSTNKRIAFFTLLVSYAVGAFFLPFFEGESSPFADPVDYFYWFMVTATTVGYGDISPSTPEGKIIVCLMSLAMIVAIGFLLGVILEHLDERRKQRVSGKHQLDLEGHIVILGYKKGESEALVEEILADGKCDENGLVLCSDEVAQNPMVDKLNFVHGSYVERDTYDRACLFSASKILVYCPDDATTFSTAITAYEMKKPEAHMVAFAYSSKFKKQFELLNKEIEVVTPMGIQVMAQALQDPGTSLIFQALTSNLDKEVLFRLWVPEEFTKEVSFEELSAYFLKKYQAILISASTGDDAKKVEINPQFPLKGGMHLYYIAAQRVDSDSFAWPE